MSLRRRTIGAAQWTAVSFAVALAVQLGQIALLARLLEPSAMGLIAIVGLLNAFVDIFLGMGIAQAIIQRRSTTSFELASVFWLNLAVGAAVTVVVGAAAGPLAALLGASDAAPLLRVASLVFVCSAAGQVPRAVLEKGIRFRAVAIAETVSLAVGFAVTVGLALSGGEASSYAWGLVATAAVRTVLVHVRARRIFRIRMRFRLREVRRFLSFGAYQTLDALVNYIGSNVSSLAVGRLLGPVQLGGYTLGYNVAVNLPARVNPIVTRVMFPVLSSIQDDRGRVARSYLGATAVLSMASIPPLAFIALRSEEVVRLFYGPDWAWIAGLTSALTVVGAARAIGNPVGPLLMATDRVRFGLVVNVGKTAVTVALIVTGGVLADLDGIIAGLVATSVLSLVVTYAVLRVVIGVGIAPFLRAALAGPALAAPAALSLLGTGLLPANAPVRLLPVELLVYAAVVVLTALWMPGAQASELRRMVLGRLAGRSPRAVPDVAVVLAAEERFDGSGGAVATWIRETVSRSSLRMVVHSPRAAAANGVDVARHRFYDVVYTVQRTLALRLARATGGDPAQTLRRLSLGGRLWLISVAPAVRRAPTVWIHNRPRYALRLRRLGYRGRIVVHMHNDLSAYLPADRAAAQVYLSAVDTWFFCSEFLRDRAVAAFGLGSTEVLVNGVVPPGAAPDHQGGGPLVAVFAGRLIPEKGALDAVGVVTRVREESGLDVRLVIAGASGLGTDASETPYVRQLDAAIEAAAGSSHGAVIERSPFLPHDHLLELFAQASVLLYPCRWDEPFGMVVIEALSRGLPVLTVERGGLPEILLEEDGSVVRGSVLVPPGSPEEVERALVAAVVALAPSLLDPGERAAIAGASRRRSAAFGWPAIAARADELLGPRARA